MRFLIDAQLPPALARRIDALGHEGIHVAEAGLLAARDRETWAHAAATGASLITKDEDFVTMRAFNSRGPAIVWIRVGNTTNKLLLAHFTAVFSQVLSAIGRGETVVEVSGP